ncbi:MAG: hypothetical protein M3O30_17355 [Planctomycetota bacterium]|nr:hypothetical protein [Planctomycetota bacterium]
MPVGIDPNEKYSYVISTDRAKPPELQPKLIFHYATGREQRRVGEMFDAAGEAKTLEESFSLRADAVRVLLVGWEKFTDRQGNPIPYDPASLDAVLSDTDLSELDACLLKDMSLSELDKKKFVLFARSSSASSAANARADDAPPTDPAAFAPGNSAASPAREKTSDASPAADGASGS